MNSLTATEPNIRLDVGLTERAAIEVVGLRKGFGATAGARRGDEVVASGTGADADAAGASGPVTVLDDVDLQVLPGRVVALLGPSGCGKTTLLRTIAGLERPDAGEVRLDGTVVAGRGRHVPPERRHVGMVFQDWALFPHLDVGRNVGYGLPRGERAGPRVAEVLRLVGLAGLERRSPTTLSGGQQQRVALARALAPRPRVLLLDEPFSNLDTALRVQVRSEVHELLTELGVTTLFVTHDQTEAFVLGDEVAVLHGGRIVQQAGPAELYARPATPWVARFVGDANLLAGVARDGRARTCIGPVALDRPGGIGDGSVEVLLRPEDLRLDGDDTTTPTAATGATGTVERREYYGHDTVYLVRCPDGTTVRVRAGSTPRFARGDRVTVSYVGPPAVAFSPA